MGFQDQVVNDLNLIFSKDVFFAETVSYFSLNEDLTFTETEINVNLVRGREMLDKDFDGGQVLPAVVHIQTSDIAEPKVGDYIVDSSNLRWDLQDQVREEFGKESWVIETDRRIRYRRQNA